MHLVDAFPISFTMASSQLPQKVDTNNSILLFQERLKRLAVFNSLVRSCDAVQGHPRIGSSLLLWSRYLPWLMPLLLAVVIEMSICFSRLQLSLSIAPDLDHDGFALNKVIDIEVEGGWTGTTTRPLDVRTNVLVDGVAGQPMPDVAELEQLWKCATKMLHLATVDGANDEGLPPKKKSRTDNTT